LLCRFKNVIANPKGLVHLRKNFEEKSMLSTTLPYCIVEGRKGLIICFDKENPEMFLADKSCVGLSDDELKLALDKPFFVLEDITIYVIYGENVYKWIIPKGYDWNGANVPAFAWLLIGQQKEPRFKLASCVHDYMCEHHEVVGNDRYLSTLIFETLCEYFGRFNSFKRWAMFHSVDNFQKIAGKDLNKKRWGKTK
jgi:hypothetical protein